MQADGDFVLGLFELDVLDPLHHVMRFLEQNFMVKQRKISRSRPDVIRPAGEQGVRLSRHLSCFVHPFLRRLFVQPAALLMQG